MAKFEFDETAHKNIMVFLSRVDLKGSEAQEFLKIIQILSNPIQENQTIQGDATHVTN
jgi:hypothetical protein